MTNNFTPPKQNTGNVYKNRYKDNDRKPDWTGKIEVSKEFLKDLVSKVKNGDEAVIEVAQWNRVAKNSGNPYMYTTLAEPWQKKEQNFAQEEPQTKTEEIEEFDEDDIPF